MKKIYLLLAYCAVIQCVSGQSFQAVCPTSNTNGTLVDFEHFHDTLYATGFFNTICNTPVGYIAKWANETWEPAAISIADPGHALRVINAQLYIAKYVESVDSNWVYVYDTTSLEKLGAGVYLTTASGFSQLPNIYDIVDYNGNIVACGEFDRVGADTIQGIMQWDGSHWEALGTGLKGNIPGTAPVMFPHQMMVHNGELYVVGNFKDAGSEQVNGIAKWDGTEWLKMGDGFNGTVYSITVFNDEIIAGGSFTQSGGTTVNRIAKWDGLAWVPLDFGFSQPSFNDFIFVHTLQIIEDVLYIAGGIKEISYANGAIEPCNGIIAYAADSINTFDGGVPGNDIEAIAKIGDERLLVGGGVFGSGYSGITDLISTHLHAHDLGPAVRIFPNPFEHAIDIMTDRVIETYEIIDGYGKRVGKGAYHGREIQVNVPPGVYFIKLTDQFSASSIHKIIKL